MEGQTEQKNESAVEQKNEMSETKEQKIEHIEQTEKKHKMNDDYDPVEKEIPQFSKLNDLICDRQILRQARKMAENAFQNMMKEFNEKLMDLTNQIDKIQNDTSKECEDCEECENCDNCKDCDRCDKCSYCKDCYKCINCESCQLSKMCVNCKDCDRCENCTNCENCYNCENQKDKQYMVNDIQYKTSQDYIQARTAELTSSSETTSDSGSYYSYNSGKSESMNELLNRSSTETESDKQVNMEHECLSDCSSELK